MAKRIVEEASLTAVAEAIRRKAGTEEALVFPDGFISTVDSIPAEELQSLLDGLLQRNLSILSTDKITSLGRYVFYQFSALREVSLPALHTIGENSFQSCTNLTTVSIPNAAELGLACFQSCSNLTSVYAPNVTKMHDSFYYCTRLPSISLPKLQSLTTQAFGRCAALRYADLGYVSKMSTKVFLNCTSLETLVLRNAEQVCTIDATSFDGSTFKTGTLTPTVYVPKALVDAYAAADVWKDLTCQFAAIEDNASLTTEEI